MATRTSNASLTGIIIICILFLSMLVRCTAPETQAQMQRDISGLTQAQKNTVVSWQQNKIFLGQLP